MQTISVYNKGGNYMNTKIKIGLILIIYAALAVIPGVLGYLQYNTEQVTQYGGGKCGSCHVDPNGSTSTNISFSNKTNQIPDTNATENRTLQGTENPLIFEGTHKQKN